MALVENHIPDMYTAVTGCSDCHQERPPGLFDQSLIHGPVPHDVIPTCAIRSPALQVSLV